MDNPFPRYDLFSCELGMENDGYDDNNDNDENITIGSLEDFADLIFFLFSWNAFKNPNGIIDGRPKTCFWLRPAVRHIFSLICSLSASGLTWLHQKILAIPGKQERAL